MLAEDKPRTWKLIYNCLNKIWCNPTLLSHLIAISKDSKHLGTAFTDGQWLKLKFRFMHTFDFSEVDIDGHHYHKADARIPIWCIKMQYRQESRCYDHAKIFGMYKALFMWNCLIWRRLLLLKYIEQQSVVNETAQNLLTWMLRISIFYVPSFFFFFWIINVSKIILINLWLKTIVTPL